MSEEFDLEKFAREITEIDEFKEVLAYNQSEENKKNCEPFELLNQKYISLQKQYSNSFHKLSEDVESKVYRREYAKGGEGFHRGVYSPSMMDLVVGGVNRGALLKRPPKDNKYNYEYLFDAQDNLICVYGYNNFNGIYKLVTTELFVHQPNIILSLVYDSDENHGLSFMSECQYDNGRLVRYENVLCDLYVGGKGCVEINVEIHEYVGNILQSLHWYRYMHSIQLLEHEKYTFTRDKDGYLSIYTVEQIGGFKTKTDFNCEKVIYNVRKKRK
jgi:hypothetical protein